MGVNRLRNNRKRKYINSIASLIRVLAVLCMWREKCIFALLKSMRRWQ